MMASNTGTFTRPKSLVGKMINPIIGSGSLVTTYTLANAYRNWASNSVLPHELDWFAARELAFDFFRLFFLYIERSIKATGRQFDEFDCAHTSVPTFIEVVNNAGGILNAVEACGSIRPRLHFGEGMR